jgi:hypothetical protein
MRLAEKLDWKGLNESKFEVAFLIVRYGHYGSRSVYRLTSLVASFPWIMFVSTVFPPINCFLQVTHLQHDTLTVAKSQNLFQ